nr:hypothetical protein CFP56_29911 [Quercus suber]
MVVEQHRGCRISFAGRSLLPTLRPPTMFFTPATYLSRATGAHAEYHRSPLQAVMHRRDFVSEEARPWTWLTGTATSRISMSTWRIT